jgi:predicted DNA-binding protein YlxM (UPF0122 family)
MGQFSIDPGTLPLVESDLDRGPAQRETMELLRSRIDLLTGTDRTLIMMYLEHGNSVRQIAELAGLQTSTVARRIHRIVERLHDETFLLCLKQRDSFSELELAIVKDYFVLGLSASRISSNRNVSYYRARAAIRKARQLASASWASPG